MADLGTKLTDERMIRLAKRLNGVYSAALRTALNREREWLNRLNSLPENAPIEKRTAFANEHIRRGEQVRRISAEIAGTSEQAERIINRAMGDIYEINKDFQDFSINRKVGLNLDWTIYDRRQIDVLMRENQSPFTKIAYRNLGKDAVITQRLQNQLAQSVILGESQQKLINRIRSVTGQSAWQARRIAQTERVRVQNEARFHSMQEGADMGLDIQKRWISRMDSRVRDDHAEVTGEVVPYDKEFSNGLLFPGDPNGEAAQVINCRCIMQELISDEGLPALRALRERFDMDMGFEEWREVRKTPEYINEGIKYSKFAAVEVDGKMRDQLAVNFDKYGGEFLGFNKKQYRERAAELLGANVGGDVLGFVGENGKRYRYNQKTNEFVVGNATGTIGTMFKPDDEKEFWKRTIARYG